MPLTPASIGRTLVGMAALVIGAVVIYFAMIFDGPFPDDPRLQGHNDLVLHVAAFLALSTPVLLVARGRRSLAGLVVFAGSIEIVQLFEPRRTADWLDFAGSVAGVVLAAMLVGGLRWMASRWASKGVNRDE